MRPAPKARSQGSEFRPPLLSLIYSMAWSAVTYQLYMLGKTGWEWGTLASFVAGGLAIKLLVKAMDDQFKVRALRRRKKNYKAGKPAHGKARLATFDDIVSAESLNSRHGIFMGMVSDGKRSVQKVFYDGPGSIAAIAMPGQLKTMSVVVPSILSSNTNLIVNDPAGEALSICWQALQKRGFRVQVLTPFPKQVSELTGFDVQDAHLDIFSAFHPQMDPASVPIKLKQAFKWAMPGKPHMDEKSEYFHEDARSLGSFFSMRRILNGQKPTLADIREDLMLGPAAIHDFAEQAIGSPAFHGFYDELGRSLSGIFSAASQQFAAGYGTAKQYLDPYTAALGTHTSGDGFDPCVLKDPNQRTALFIVPTLGMMKTLATLTSMTLTYLFDMIAEDPQQGTCTALIDECGGFYMPSLPGSLLFYRKQGLRCLMIWQDLCGQSEKLYGKAGMREILAASQLKIAMGIQEPETLEMFSKLCGTRSIDDMALSDRASMSDSIPDLSPGHNIRGVPLMRPEEIGLLKEELLVVGGQMHPMVLKKLPYWKCRQWSKAARNSPFYRG